MKVREYLTFTKRERNGILSVVAIMLLIVFSPKYFCRSAPVEQVVNHEATDSSEGPAVDTPKPGSTYASRRVVVKNKAGPRYPVKKLEPFDINVADTTRFIALPGIGSKLAARIVMFRDKLGGFYDVKQVGEVYGLQDSVFKKIHPFLRCDPGVIRRIAINDADKEELKTHPYIRWSIAEAIVSYRDQHGRYSSKEDLFKLENVDVELLEKAMPYISFK